MFYIVTGLSLSFLCLIRVLAKYNTILVEFIYLFIFILLATFRAESVGADTKTYTSYFINSPNIFHYDKNYLDYLEFGFTIYLALVKTISSNVTFFYFVSSIFAILPVYLGLKKLRIQYSILGLLFFLLIFYIPYPLNALRQSIVMGLFIYSLHYFITKDFFKVFFIALIGLSFHSSGVFILFAYFIFNADLRKSATICFFSIFFIFFLYYFNLIQFFLFNFAGVDQVTYSDIYSEKTNLSQYLYRVLILAILAFFVFNSNNINMKKFFIIYFFGFCLFVSLSDNNMIATRFNMFFRIIEIVLIPMILNGLSLLLKLVVFLFLLMVSFFIYYQTSFLPENIYMLKF